MGLDVRNHIADSRPGRGDIAGFCGVTQIDEHRRLAGDGDALGVIERLQFFELLLNPVGDLARELLGGGARPLGLDHHGLDRESGIFFPSELQVREEACRHEGDHEIPDKRAVSQRPFGKVERASWGGILFNADFLS